jgi:hypothetical protein
MRIIDLVKAKNGPTISFEMTRPKSEKGEANIGTALDKLVVLKPDFFTMTFGADGGTRDGSLQMLQRIHTERKQNVFAHLAGYGMSPTHLDETVEKFKEIALIKLDQSITSLLRHYSQMRLHHPYLAVSIFTAQLTINGCRITFRIIL